jgi:hypothetical protein
MTLLVSLMDDLGTPKPVVPSTWFPTHFKLITSLPNHMVIFQDSLSAPDSLTAHCPGLRVAARLPSDCPLRCPHSLAQYDVWAQTPRHLSKHHGLHLWFACLANSESTFPVLWFQLLLLFFLNHILGSLTHSFSILVNL